MDGPTVLLTPTRKKAVRSGSLATAALVLGACAFAPMTQAVASPVVPGDLSAVSTTQSIGLEWLVSGDTNHNATANVEYREMGQATWQPAMGLIRVDSGSGNSLAGSIMFLQSGTSYEVRVTLADPDGGGDTRTVPVATLAVPTLPAATRTLHVVPGSGGGDGSSQNPYQGLETAWSNAQPGDELLLHVGNYGGVTDSNGVSGIAGAPIVIRNAGDGEVQLSYLQVFQRSHLWIEGLTFRYDGTSDTGFYSSLLNPGYDTGFQAMLADVDNIVLKNNHFEGYKHSIRAGPRTSRWFIADNTIIGDKQLGASGTPSFDGEGIELGHGDNHEVAYNSITLVGDGVSFPNENCDIYGNDIFDVTDDGIELDGGEANTRAWQNRIHNASHNGIAFQPQSGAPWYIVRNQIVNSQESIFKFRNGDRFVAINNTFVNWGDVLDHWSHQLLRGVTRNNLWISANNGSIWRRGSEGTSWRTDHDYDGFDWGSNSQPFEINGTVYSSLAQLRSGAGLQDNGIEIDAATCLESFDVPGPPPLTTIPPQFMTLEQTCNAVDAGIAIPNISSNFSGNAPDLGAYERGQPLPHYGPRAATTPVNRAPNADAGPDQVADEATTVVVSASASSDPDGDALTYNWTQVSGTAATVVGAGQATTDIDLPDLASSEVLVFRVTVTDTSNVSDSDEVAITVNDLQSPNRPPVANAGADTSGNEGTTVVLSAGQSTDPDGDSMQYSWQQVSGPAATITNADQMQASVTLPQVTTDTSLEFQLTVSDPSAAASTDTVIVTVNDVPANNNPPADDDSGGGAMSLPWLLLAGLLGAFGQRRRRSIAY